MRKNSEQTLRNQRDFNRLYNKGKSRGSRYAVVIYRRNDLGFSRKAFVASKKVGNSVKRNRARRLMREAYMNIADRISKGYDIVFIARNTINEADSNDVSKSLFGTLRALGLIDNNEK